MERNIMLKTRLLILALAGLAVAGWSTGSAGAATKAKYLNLTSPDFKDGGKLPRKYAGKNAQNPNCIGDNISPALNWTGAPEKTKSYAIMLFDTAGRAPLGVVHWLAYGIPASKTGFKEGEAANPPAGWMGGKSTMNLPSYYGPCPPKGVKPHPYVFTLMATDLAPDALQAGMDQAALGAAMQGHLLESVSLVSRFGH
jgi:Raf kinase inhibitor-like YbhB/YbcL family protein